MVDPAVLRCHPFLGDAAGPAITLLADRANLKHWRARQVVFRRGDPAVGLILVLEGRVRVLRESNGRRQLIHVEAAGGTLGEVPMFDGGPMPASAIAAEPTRAVVVAPDLLRSAMLLDGHLALKLLERLARRVRGLADRLERVTRHSVGMRLAAALVERVDRSASHVLNLGMSQGQFAEELGTVREVVVRELGALVRAGVLAPLGRGRFEVRDLTVLQRLAAGQEWNPGSMHGGPPAV